ncbi:hypothetical protein CL634_10820 [bacterium]|nr:hypothetical protein [bacterium]|tara:strand:- start:96 stop:590 length:495 start_codon:yes stop_codon:yes gene_type:complete
MAINKILGVSYASIAKLLGIAKAGISKIAGSEAGGGEVSCGDSAGLYGSSNSGPGDYPRGWDACNHACMMGAVGHPQAVQPWYRADTPASHEQLYTDDTCGTELDLSGGGAQHYYKMIMGSVYVFYVGTDGKVYLPLDHSTGTNLGNTTAGQTNCAGGSAVCTS